MATGPLSEFQREYAERERRRPGTFATILRSFTLDGPLDVDALDRSLAAVVERHDALRTRVVDVAGEPQQTVDDSVAITLTVVETIEDAVAELERAAAEEPFDLAAGPLFRAGLLRLAPDRHVLVLTVHHIVCDGWSMQVLLEDLETRYTAERDGGPLPRERPPYGQGDVVTWQAAQTARELPPSDRGPTC